MSEEPFNIHADTIKLLAQAMLEQINKFDFGPLKDDAKALIVHAVILTAVSACRDVGLEAERLKELVQLNIDHIYKAKEQISSH